MVQLYPFAALRADYHNVHFRGQMHPQPWVAADFLPGKKPQSVEDQVASLVAYKEMAESMGSDVIKQREEVVKQTDPVAVDRWAALKAQVGK